MSAGASAAFAIGVSTAGGTTIGASLTTSAFITGGSAFTSGVSSCLTIGFSATTFGSAFISAFTSAFTSGVGSSTAFSTTASVLISSFLRTAFFTGFSSSSSTFVSFEDFFFLPASISIIPTTLGPSIFSAFALITVSFSFSLAGTSIFLGFAGSSIVGFAEPTFLIKISGESSSFLLATVFGFSSASNTTASLRILLCANCCASSFADLSP